MATVQGVGVLKKYRRNMENKFNLSEKIQNDILMLCALSNDRTENKTELFIKVTEQLENDIKEFIRLVKDIQHLKKCKFCLEDIDKLAGEKLI